MWEKLYHSALPAINLAGRNPSSESWSDSFPISLSPPFLFKRNFIYLEPSLRSQKSRGSLKVMTKKEVMLEENLGLSRFRLKL